MTTTALSPSVLDMDCAAAVTEIETSLRNHTRALHRRGLVLGVSGGIDSSVCAGLAAKAVGPDRVLAILMPERDSSPESSKKGRIVCETFKIPYVVEDIAAPLEALGCYRRRDEAITRLIPEYRPGNRFKIVVASDLLNSDRMNYFSLIVELAGGTQTRRLPLDDYLQIVAATNFKQRVRKMIEYYHAERLNHAVLGTPNRLEYDQGFFVRGGDGLADIKPIAHLYKTQVFALARHLGLPREICEQTPSTDTYSLPQTQEEFYFALPYKQMDLLLHAYINGLAPAVSAEGLHLTAEQVERVYRDIEAKRKVAKQLHQPAALVREYHWGPAQR